jgi:hypothetical protein
MRDNSDSKVYPNIVMKKKGREGDVQGTIPLYIMSLSSLVDPTVP